MSLLARHPARIAISTMFVGTALLSGHVADARTIDAHEFHTTVSQSGLHIFSINGRPYGIRTAIHVLTFGGSQYSLAIGLSHNAIDGGLATTSSMCQSTSGCVAAINADFFDLTPTGKPDPGDEVGGIIKNCVLLHTPQISHQQVDIDNRSVSSSFNWSSTLSVNGSSIPITAINQELPLSYANVNLPLTGTLLYTPPYALAIPANAGRVVYEFTQVDATTSPTMINSSATLTFVGISTQSVRLGNGQVDISTPPNPVLAALQPGNTVTLSTTSSAGCNSIGGHPILVNQGVVQPIAHADTYMLKPYARSVIGWTESGVTVLIAVDGQDTVRGATAYQLDHLLSSLGVVTALDFDGGNSTTFYAQGRVLNKPSRGREHPVSTSLLVIAASSTTG